MKSYHFKISKNALALSLLLMLANSFLYGQINTITIRGQIHDQQQRHLAIPDVSIFFKSNPSSIVRSDVNGKFTFTLTDEKTDTLVFRHSGYQLYEQPILLSQLKKNRSNGITFNIVLKHVTLEPFTLSYQKIDTVFGSKQVSVEDYCIFEDGSRLLIVYEKTIQKGSKLWYLDKSNSLIDQYHLYEQPHYFYRDYAKRLHLICEQKVYEINIRHEKIRLSTIDPELFYGYRQRILDTLPGHYYYTDYSPTYPAVKFITTRIEDTTHYVIREVKDDFMMELYRAQYKYVSGRDKLWAYRKEQETGIDKEIWVGAVIFTQDVLYRPVYAPLFIKEDTLLIFDQYRSYLYRYNSLHMLIDSVFVNYYKNPKGEKWEQPLMRDEITGAIYSLYNKGGYYYLRCLNTSSGILTTTTRISYQFVHHIRIHNGYVYYIYRPFESSQRKFLYREKIHQESDLSH
jgi:hypothetical protein